MIALDTNVLVRLLTADDPRQFARARAFIHANAAREGEVPSLFVSPIVVCELLRVLGRNYRHSRQDQSKVLQGLLDSRDLVVGDRDAIQAALSAYQAGRGGFIDYYIRESALGAGCESVATFDGTLLKYEGFRAVC